MTPEVCREIWYHALASEVGIAIVTEASGIKTICNELYEARRAIADPKLESIIICLPASIDEIWMCKKEVELDP